MTPIDAGVDAIQLRERDLDARRVAPDSPRGRRRARGQRRRRVLVNDRADVALAAGAAGVHLPGDGIPVQAGAARSIRTGSSVDPSMLTTRRTAWAGADYVLFGAVFATASKPAGWIPAGLGALAGLVRSTPVPVIAIGGITEANAEEAGAAGAAGVAAIGAFSRRERLAARCQTRRARPHARRSRADEPGGRDGRLPAVRFDTRGHRWYSNRPS